MKILHINCNYVGTALHRVMIEHLDKDNIHSLVFAPISTQASSKAFAARNNEIISPCFSQVDRILYFYKQKKIQKALLSSVTDIEDFDYIHAYTLLTDGNIAYRIAKRYSIPYVVAIRDTDVNDFFRLKPYLRSLGINIMRHAEAVFFLSEPQRQKVLNVFVPKKWRDDISQKTYVITNGIDDFWLDNKFNIRDYEAIENRIAQKNVNLVCVGRINKRKNIPCIQNALRILNTNGWTVHLDVIGNAENKDELDIITSDKNTTYHPAMDKKELIDYYRAGDIFVLASHKETFGLVYAEAMTQSMPVIYTRGQGFDGQFQDGEVGYAVDDMKPDEVANRIVKICEQYRKISNTALTLVEKYRWDTICGKYRAIYKGDQLYE